VEETVSQLCQGMTVSYFCNPRFSQSEKFYNDMRKSMLCLLRSSVVNSVYVIWSSVNVFTPSTIFTSLLLNTQVQFLVYTAK
jgi:hypothetical protein